MQRGHSKRITFQIERNAIIVTVFLLIMNQKKFRLVKSQKENCWPVRSHIPFNLKGMRKLFP